MANPYGIVGVDIPGMLGMHQQMKRQRMDDLYRAKQIEREDREIARDEKKAGIRARLFTGGGAEATTNAAPSTSVATPDAVSPAMPGAATGEPGTAPALPSQLPTPQPRQDGIQINQGALRELFAVDPEMAIKFQEFGAKAEEAQLKKVAAHGEVKAQAAKYLMRFRAGPERQAAFRQIAPDLLARGFSEQDLASADLSDKMLNKDVVFGMTLKDLVSQENADRDDAESRRRWEAQEARAARNEGRAAVRFEERQLDRDAVGGRVSGLSTQALIDMATGN